MNATSLGGQNHAREVESRAGTGSGGCTRRRVHLPNHSRRTAPLAERPETVSDDQVVLHEDEWRQIEFVASESLDEVQESLAELDTFKRDNRVGVGYGKVFLRRDLPTSLATGGVTLEDVLGTNDLSAHILQAASAR